MIDRTRQSCCCCDVCFWPIKTFSLEWKKCYYFQEKFQVIFCFDPQQEGRGFPIWVFISMTQNGLRWFESLHDSKVMKVWLLRKKFLHQTSQMWASSLGKWQPHSWLSSHKVALASTGFSVLNPENYAILPFPQLPATEHMAWHLGLSSLRKSLASNPSGMPTRKVCPSLLGPHVLFCWSDAGSVYFHCVVQMKIVLAKQNNMNCWWPK